MTQKTPLRLHLITSERSSLIIATSLCTISNYKCFAKDTCVAFIIS